ncbi:MAG: gliding motility-associated C-terminal domain-containing protein, partial [Bacteroidota bacterium]
NPGGITGYGTSTVLENLAPGTYNFTIYSDPGCISHASADIVINSAPTAPTAPLVGTITQPSSCTSTTGSVVLNGLPATGTWTINPGAIRGTGTSTPISNLIPGTYNFSVTAAAGCISNASADVVINAAPVAPTAPITGTITQPSSCAAPTGSVVLNGLPATGTWTINPGSITGTGTSTTIINLIPGTYKFNITSDAGCISLPSTDVVIISPPGTPATLRIGAITQPSSCASATGSVVINGLPATEMWTINPGAITGTGTTTIVTKLIPGTYNFTVTIASGCTSLASSTVVIDTPTGIPATPTLGTITQPTCALATGSVILNDLPAGDWTINPGTITGSTASTTITGLAANTYNFTVTNAEGCTSVASTDVLINVAPEAPTAPTCTVADPTCTTTGTIAITSATAGLTFSLDGTAYTAYPAGGFISVAAGPHTLTAQNTGNCLSAVTNVTVNAQIIISDNYTKELSDYKGFNISCHGQSNGFIRINPSAELATYTFTWSGPRGFTASTKDISELIAGQYTLLITDNNLCTWEETIKLSEPEPLSMTFDPSLSPAGGFNISCAGSKTGSVTVSAQNYAGTVDYRWADGVTGNSRTDLSAGIYTIIITDSNNCNADSTVTLTEPDALKLAFDITEPFCPDKADGEIRLTVTGGVPGNDYIYKWSDNSTDKNISNIASGTYKVTVTDMNGCSINNSTEVNSVNKICLIIPDAISPNDDLINDVWNISNANLYPQIEITVYNRWGQSVWISEQGYPLPWDGRSNGEKLPLDSYHYAIELNNGSKPFVGTITIVR